MKFSGLIILLACSLLQSGCFLSESSNKNKKDTIAAPVPAISAAEKSKYNSIVSHFYDSILKRSGFNGAMLVAKKGEIVFEKYAGTKHLKQNDSIDQHTAFHLASVSKTFTGMAILHLWEQGKLSLTDTLGIYFPAFPYPGVTIQMLLSHRSGLPNYTHYFDAYKWDKKIRISNEDVLKSLYDFKPPLQFSIGKHFGYCNTNYALLALIIEKVSGKWYGDYLKEIIFDPLDMTNTFVFQWKDSATATPSYESNGRLYPFDYLDLVYGDKNIYSTPRDLLKWDQALYKNTIFNAATLEAAFTPYSFEKPGVRNYGLGWRLQVPANAAKIVYHNGWWHGNNTVFTRLIADSATIIVLGNKRNSGIYQVKPLYRHFPHYDGTHQYVEE